MSLIPPLTERLDRLLPQTQCGQCGYDGGRPYAQAMARGEVGVDRCPPGGDAGARALSQVLGEPAIQFDRSRGEHKVPQLALIVEADCLGCTKCIQACPVDAIVGAAKRMHSVIAKLCTGCDLCLPPCPVDCIDMLPVAEAQASWTQAMADAARSRFQFRGVRLARGEAEHARRLAWKDEDKRGQPMADAKKAVILAAIARAKARTAAVQPRNTDRLPPRAQAELAAIDPRRAAAKKR